MSQATTGRTEKIWRDGQLVNWDDAKIHVISHVVHYGSSVFEGMRCYATPAGGAVFRAREHMRRLIDSCKIYRIPMQYSVDELVDGCLETIAANDLDECYFRPVVIRTGEQMGVLGNSARTEVFMIAWKWGSYLGDDGMANGVDVRVSSWRRAAPDTFPTMAKAGGNYLNSQLAKMEAKADGYSEGIMLDASGFVSEGSGENLFAVRDGVLYTSPLSAGILPGITRDAIIQLAADLGIPVREELLPREFLYIADELFFCGTAVEVTPIRSVDRMPVGAGKRGPVTERLQRLYLDLVHGREPDAHGWLTHVPAAAGAAR
ncbi:MAG: branched-chain amino acid transaminase [Gemmatimonadota bacterium]|nr:branched-chain amino acid transaminase [Gemmatimonadota bacterium]HEU4990094.1 branched-chain amino acid transaminase [Gemmatimonadaceae bacterium]